MHLARQGYGARHARCLRSKVYRDTDTVTHTEVTVNAEHGALAGTLSLPSSFGGLVIFAHGSGSSRHSPRNRVVADLLNEHRLGTLLLELSTAGERGNDARSSQAPFDLELLAQRLTSAIDWAQAQHTLGSVKIGLLGASTGAAVALAAATRRPQLVRAIVSRGGRPDLASDALHDVAAPTLLIVGSRDEAVLALNQRALRQLPSARLEVVPGASHLFEEPGALRVVGDLTTSWFLRELKGRELVVP